MKQTILLEFDPKDASDSACYKIGCCMVMNKQGKFCELCLIKVVTIWKCESQFIFVTIVGYYE